MPVQIEIKDRSAAPARGTKGAPLPPEEAINSATDAEEKRKGATALLLWLVALAIFCLPWYFLSEATLPFAIGMPIWAVASIAGFFMLAPRLELGPLEKDAKARISTKNRAALKNVLAKVAPILGEAEPEAFVDAHAEDANLRVLPKTLIVNEALYNVCNESEVNVLAVRGVAHQRLGHARRLMIMDTLERLPSPVFKFLVWPVWIYVRLLEALWIHHAQQSADRVALLVIRNHSLLLSAIVKEKAANDAHMKDLGVESSDVANWVAQKGHIGMEGKEISTQYKLGRAIHEDPPFEARLLGLQFWHASKDFETAVEKLAKRK